MARTENPKDVNDPDLAAAGTVLFPFLRTLAHDMAAPLTSTLGYAQLNLEAPGSPEELRDDLQQIEQAALSLRQKLGCLSRLSRYVPSEVVSPAGELLTDLRSLTGTLSMSAGQRLKWQQQEPFSEDKLKGNPWLLRAACLALLGSLCNDATEVAVTRIEGAVAICFPPPNEAVVQAAPNLWGCPSLGERLLERQAIPLEKNELWRICLTLEG